MVYICKICNQSFPNKWEYELHFPNALEHKSKKELTEIIAVIQEKNTKLQRVRDCAEIALKVCKNPKQFSLADRILIAHKLQISIKESEK